MKKLLSIFMLALGAAVFAFEKAPVPSPHMEYLEAIQNQQLLQAAHVRLQLRVWDVGPLDNFIKQEIEEMRKSEDVLSNAHANRLLYSHNIAVRVGNFMIRRFVEEVRNRANQCALNRRALTNEIFKRNWLYAKI